MEIYCSISMDSFNMNNSVIHVCFILFIIYFSDNRSGF